MEMDDLPPDHMPVGDLIRWLTVQLGRRPTLLDLAELRCAMVLRTRRARSVRPVPRRGRAQSSRDYVREILASEEKQVFMLALSVLPSLAAAVIRADFDIAAADRRTNPDGILALARDTRSAAKRHPGAGALFEPPLRKQVKPITEYLCYKIAGGPDFGPAMARPGALCDESVLAAINANHEGQAREWRRRLDDGSDAARRTTIADMRAAGRAVLERYPLLGRSLPGPLAAAPATPEPTDPEQPLPPAPGR